MIARVRGALVLASVVLLVAAAPGAAGGEPAFTVTGPTGTYAASSAELAHWVRVARRSYGPGMTRREARMPAFELVLSFAWIEGEAAERGLVVSEEAAHRRFLVQKRQSFPRERDFRRFLRATGQTVADIERRVRLDMLSNRIRDQVVAPVAATITDAVVDDHIAKHGHVRAPEQRDIRIPVLAAGAQVRHRRAAVHPTVRREAELEAFRHRRAAVRLDV